MKTLALTAFQFRALSALREFAAHVGWKGDIELVEDTLVYQFPLREHPDVTGAFFALEGDEPNLRLYLALPGKIDADRLAEAYEFAARQGYGIKSGALEMSTQHGNLRVRIDSDTTPDTVGETASRLVERGMALARVVSPAWRSLCMVPGLPGTRSDISDSKVSTRQEGT